MKQHFARKFVNSLLLIRYPIMLVGVFFAALFLVGSVFVEDVTSITIADGDALYELTTTCDTVSEALDLHSID